MAEIEGETGTSESFFTNADGKKIFCRYWCEDLKDPRALVMISHGAGEHCLWYTPLALLLKENLITAVESGLNAILKEDCIGGKPFLAGSVGHGQSEGDRVHVDNFHEYVRDSFEHFDTVAKKFPSLPKFIIGHSMGGAITIISAIERPDYFSGVVLIAPAVIPDPATVSPLKVFLGKIVAKIFPQAPVIYLNPDYISRDKASVLRYKDDPLVYHGGLKAKWGASFLKWLQFVEANMAVLRSPLLAMHGTEDKLTHPDGSRMLNNRVSSTDKTLKIYEGYYHQLHYEPGEDGAGVRQCVVEWITSRIPQIQQKDLTR